MAVRAEVVCDVVVLGGGAAGLWLLDDLVRDGYTVLLLERFELGRGQTIGSQGIIHGGLKYTLDGLLSPSATAIRDMPAIWRDALAGRREPNLSGTRIRAEHCYLWRTRAFMSRLGMIGARAGLRVAPVKVSGRDVPAALADCPGDVYRLDEQVIDPATFLKCLADRHADRLLEFDLNRLGFSIRRAGEVEGLEVEAQHSANAMRLVPRAVVLTAGEGNAALLERCGLSSPAMQRRPLHMAMARGSLTELNGHCTDGAKTRVTITTDVDREGRTIWQIGGQVAEAGVEMDEPELIAHARRELQEALPGVNLSGIEWAAYRAVRAEPATQTRARPSEPFAVRQGNVVTAWPTKLALAPEMSRRVRALLDPPHTNGGTLQSVPSDWPRPRVASPPWETAETWRRAD